MSASALTIPRFDWKGKSAMQAVSLDLVARRTTPPSLGRTTFAAEVTFASFSSGPTAASRCELSWFPAITTTWAPVRASRSSAS